MIDRNKPLDGLRGEFKATGLVQHMAVDCERDAIRTNTVQGYNSFFKRGMKLSISIALKALAEGSCG